MKNFSFSKALIVLATALVLISVPGFSQTTYNIDDPEKLEDQTYVPGDVIILKNGTYSTDKRIDFVGNGTATDPITFRAETPGGVKFSGGMPMNVGGDYVVIDGFHWQGGYGASNFIQFRNNTDYANHSTIQNCVIDGLAIEPDDVADDIANGSKTKHRWIVLYGTYNSVINCTFMNKNSAGALVLAEYQYNAEADRCATVGHTISNNYFYKYAKIPDTLSNSGDSETIRIGTSEFQNVNSNAILRNNYFVEADGENEIITNKSKGNTYENNTFRRCRGSLVLRHGSNATVNGNYFIGENVDGTGGIRITDSKHTITNNYIQDCITVMSQAKWNNGITFIGGGDNADVVCTSTSVSNGYQKSQNITISNNSIVNTNAPLFYNGDKGTTDPTGTVSNNLIYFAAGNANISNVISGDATNSYANMGTALTYSGNVFTGTTLGATNAGFALESAITATASGEIFTFSGSGSAGKGANMGSYTPIHDSMVGYGIGACFLNYAGGSISDGDCTIEIGDLLSVGSLPVLPAAEGTNDVAISANVGWTAVSNDAWITIDMTSGTGNDTVKVSVEQNIETTPRTGSVTFTQVAGGDDLVRTLSVTQEGADLTDLYDLINTGTGQETDKVTVHSFSKEEVNGSSKFNYAKNTLDKSNSTVWAADDGAVLAGDYKGDGEYIIYDFGSEHAIDLIQFSTTNKSEAFGYQVWVSTTGTEDSDFTRVLPTAEDLLFTATNTTDFNQYQLNSTNARYVKLIGFGRFNSDGDTRTSPWSAISEIEFYGPKSGSVNNNNVVNKAIIYPIPAANALHIKNIEGVNSVSIVGLDGKEVLSKSVNGTEIDLDISTITNGSYTLILKGEKRHQSSLLLISR